MGNMQFSFVLYDLTTDATPSNMKPAAHFQDMIDAWIEQISGDYAKAYGEVCCNFRVGGDVTAQEERSVSLQPSQEHIDGHPELQGTEEGTHNGCPHCIAAANGEPAPATTVVETVVKARAANVSDRQPGEIAINFRDTIPEAPGALAYHQTTNGVPDIEMGVDLFTDVTGVDGMSKGGSHELLELLGDAGANGWKDRQNADNLSDAAEACDFVQNTGKTASNGLYVSNFVLPSFFIPGAPGPWDNLGVMTSQYDVSNGYGITVTTPSDYNQIGGARLSQKAGHTRQVRVHGELTEKQLRRKTHPYSRMTRRGVGKEHLSKLVVKKGAAA